MNATIIKSGRLIDPHHQRDEIVDILIENGQITAIEKSISAQNQKVIDATHKIVCPGLIDLSARFREPGQTHKGNIASESRAALAGGVTSICLPPDTKPSIDSPAVVEYIREKAQLAGFPNLYTIGALTQKLAGNELNNLFALKQAGCIAVSNANEPFQNLLILRRALEYASSHDLLVFYQPREFSLSRHGCAHEGSVATRYGLPSIPAAAESIALAQCLELARLSDCRLHFSQISCKASVELLAEARKKGVKVTADVAIHQLYLADTDMQAFDSNYHVLPPLRSHEDRQSLLDAISNGTIDAIVSDHQPHDLDAKLGAFPETEPGISSIQTLIPLILRLSEETHQPLLSLIAKVTSEPARILGLSAGQLGIGATADLCIIDPKATWKANHDHWLSRGINSPFWQTSLKGQVCHTLIAGHHVYSLSS